MSFYNNNNTNIRVSSHLSNVRDTSKTSYHNNYYSGKNYQNRQKVMALVALEKQPMTRLMIAEKLLIASSTLSFPILQLIKEGRLVELYKAPCKVTGNKAYYLVISKNDMQDER